MNSEVVFDIAVLVESIIAISAKIHRVVPLGGNVENFFREVNTFFASHIRNGIIVSM